MMTEPARSPLISIPELLDERIAATPDEVAFSSTSEIVTWSEFGTRAEALAFGLRDLGVCPGDAVAVLGETTGEWAVSDLGILGAGGISVGLYQTLPPVQIGHVLEDCRARVVIAGSAAAVAALRESGAAIDAIVGWGDAEGSDSQVVGFGDLLRKGADLARRHRSEVSCGRDSRGPDDTAVIIYTSGTTGRSKGAMLSHRNCVFQGQTLGCLAPIDPHRDGMVSFLPMAHAVEHVMGLYGRIATGMRTRYVGGMEVADIFSNVLEVKPTLFGAVPRFYEKAVAKIRDRAATAHGFRKRLVDWGMACGDRFSRDLRDGTRPSGSLRLQHAVADRLVLSKIRAGFGGRVEWFITGAAPISLEVLEFFHAFGVVILEGYGMTECSGMATANTSQAWRLGTVGRALPGYELRCADDGELLIRSEGVFQGYLNLPEETRRTLDSDGWLHTGDIGVIDEEGWVRITDRKKDLIVTSGGKNVAPAAIEALLSAEPVLGTVVTVGDAKPYVSALISIDHAVARTLTGRVDSGAKDLVRDPLVLARVRHAIEQANAQLARYERIRRYLVLEQEFTIAGGELTPTMKPRRRFIIDRHRQDIARLYGEGDQSCVIDAELP